MPRKLPPMNAIKAFEAAARTGGYVAAARELAVSPAAVSQQVKNLEGFFGKKLFVRHSNRLSLTDAGLHVFNESHTSLETLGRMTARVFQGESRARLVVSVLPSLAARWLERRLAEFLDLEPALRLDIRVEDDPVDFARHHVDLRICYGAHLYPDLVNRLLLQDQVLPLCTASWLERALGDAPAPEQLSDDWLIHTNWGPSFASHPTWADWFRAAGIERSPDAAAGHGVGLSSLAVDLARAGVGIALGQRLLARDDLAAGRLLAPFGPAIPLGHPYCAVHAHARAQKPGLQAFADWLVQAIEA